jgi:hypothetical protein
MMNEAKEEVLRHFLELNEQDRAQVLDRIAGDEDGEPIDMLVEANLVMSADQFRQAKERLEERGYGEGIVGI